MKVYCVNCGKYIGLGTIEMQDYLCKECIVNNDVPHQYFPDHPEFQDCTDDFEFGGFEGSGESFADLFLDY